MILNDPRLFFEEVVDLYKVVLTRMKSEENAMSIDDIFKTPVVQAFGFLETLAYLRILSKF